MILIQSYQELYFALKVVQMLKESQDPDDKKISELIKNQLSKLI